MGKPSASFLPRLAALALLPVFGLCSDKPVGGIAVTISNYPSEAASLLAILTVNGKQLVAQQFNDGLAAMGPQLAFTFPLGTRGPVLLSFLAEDPNGCVLSQASQTVSISDDIRYDVMAALSSKLPAPKITSVTPGGLSNSKATDVVIITGENLYPCSHVQIGVADIMGLKYSPPSQIMLTAPPPSANTCGPVDLTVTSRDQQFDKRSDLLIYYPATPMFAAKVPVTTSYTPNELLLDDFNKDKILDVIIAPGAGVTTAQTPQIFFNDGPGTFTASQSTTAPAFAGGLTGAFSLSSGDLNKDGKTDFVYTATATENFLPTTYLVTSLQQSVGQFGIPKTQAIAGGITPNPNVIGDLNGDGHPDVVSAYGPPAFSTSLNDSIGVLLGLGDGTYNSKGPSMFGLLNNAQPKPALILADFNNDGILDLLAGTSYMGSSGMGIQVAAGKGDGTFQPVMATTVCGNAGSQSAFVTGDFNNDQKLDVSIGSHVCLGNGAGMFTDEMVSGKTPTSVAAADLNGDGKLDLVVADSTGITVYLGEGPAIFGTGIPISTSASTVVRVGNLNPDGLPDVVFGDSGAKTFEVLLQACH